METLFEALKTLETSELIRAAKLEPEIEYLFRHAIMQDAAYESLLRQDRRKLHRAVAESIEALYPQRLDELAAVLAHHYDAAGETEAALSFYRKAANVATDRYANHEAIHYLTRAYELTPESDLAARFDLILQRSKVNQVIGARSAEREDVAMMRALADQLDDPRRRAEAASQLMMLGLAVADFPLAQQAAQEAAKWGQQAAIAEIEARGYVGLGMVSWKQGDLEGARPHLTKALELARAANLPEIEADSLRNLGVLADYHGDPAEARAYLEQALPIYRKIGQRGGESAALNSLGVIALSERRFDEARGRLEESLVIKREMGHVQGIAISLGNLGVVANEQGDHAAAYRYHTECLALSRLTDDLDGEATAIAGIANVQNAIGNIEQAWSLGQESLALSRQIEEDIGIASTLLILSDIAQKRGQPAEALSLAQQGLELARKIEMREFERAAYVNLGRVSIAAAEMEQAEAHLKQVADHPEPDKWSIIAQADLARIRHMAGDLTAATSLIERVLVFIDEHGEQMQADLQVHLVSWRILEAAADPRARAVLTRAYEMLQSQAAKMDDDMRRSFLENVPAHREIIAAYQRILSA